MMPYTSLALKNSSVNFLDELFEEVDNANIQDAQELQKLLNFQHSRAFVSYTTISGGGGI
jgi:hypothetical protein